MTMLQGAIEKLGLPISPWTRTLLSRWLAEEVANLEMARDKALAARDRAREEAGDAEEAAALDAQEVLEVSRQLAAMTLQVEARDRTIETLLAQVRDCQSAARTRLVNTIDYRPPGWPV